MTDRLTTGGYLVSIENPEPCLDAIENVFHALKPVQAQCL